MSRQCQEGLFEDMGLEQRAVTGTCLEMGGMNDAECSLFPFVTRITSGYGEAELVAS